MAYVHKYAVAFDLIALKTRYWRQASGLVSTAIMMHKMLFVTTQLQT